MKILILRFSSIGDIILTTPVVRCLKTQLPGCELHYATKRSFQSILENNPYIDKLHLLEANLSKFIEALKVEKFDLLIDLHHNLRTSIIKFQLGVLSTSFSKLNIKKWLRVNLSIDCLPKLHIVDRYMDTLTSLHIMNDGEGLDYFITPAEEIAATDLPSNFMAIVIGAKFATKRLPNHKIAAICNELKQPLVLLGGKEDIQNSEEIVNQCRNVVTNLCGKLSLNQSASVLKQSSLVITHDTGLMHIAAAFSCKIISVWGNTIPEFGMYPYLPTVSSSHHLMIENKLLSCRPCSKIGYDKCPKGHFKCMEEIEIASIIQGVVTLIGD